MLSSQGGMDVALVDSETGESIAAAVDKANLGAGADVGTENFSRIGRFNEAVGTRAMVFLRSTLPVSLIGEP